MRACRSIEGSLPRHLMHGTEGECAKYGRGIDDNEMKFINLNAELIQFEVDDCARFQRLCMRRPTTPYDIHINIFIIHLYGMLYYYFLGYYTIYVFEGCVIVVSVKAVAISTHTYSMCVCEEHIFFFLDGMEKTIGKCMQNK